MPTIGEQIAELTLRDVVEGAAKQAFTKRILFRCVPQLKRIVDQVACPEVDRMAIPACYGRHVLFASTKHALICDMTRWAEPIAEITSQRDRAGLWAAMAGFIHTRNVEAAITALASRLGKDGIMQFDESMARCDTGEFSRKGTDTRVISRGGLIVLAGIDSGQAAGTIGCLPIPSFLKPGAVSEWHSDGNHRMLH